MARSTRLKGVRRKWHAGRLLAARRGTAGQIFKVDGFVGRSLFDLFSNFTYILHDTEQGDAIQQHDSRLMEGANVQYLRPHRLGGTRRC